MDILEGKMIKIFGYGTVGQGTHAIFEAYKGVPVLVDSIDPAKGYADIDEYDECECVFICVPTPTVKNKQDLRNVRNVLSTLISKGYEGPVCIRSTLTPENAKMLIREYGTIREDSADYTGLQISVWPEFLNQNSAIKDAENTETAILGGDLINTAEVRDILKNYTNIKNFEMCTIEEACYAKLFHNAFSICKGLFWEMVHDVTGNSRKIHDLVKHFPSGDMSVVGLDGYRGFGGKCFPDNLSAIAMWHTYLMTMYAYNENLLNGVDTTYTKG